MAEIRINATGGVKLYDADDSHYAQIIAGTITSNVDAITLGHDVVSIVDNLALTSDSAVLKFGADNDTTLTHTDGTGLTLNSTNKLCFNDVSQFVQGISATVLGLGATDEIDLTATAVDLNGTLDVSGNAQFSGTVTVGVDNTGLDVKLFGATSGSFLLWDESDDALELTDSSPIKIGDGGDMTVYHDGTDSFVTNSQGALKLATETSGIAVTIGHTTSETTVADNLTITGTTVGTTFDVNGTADAIILDADADTTISSPTDDQIDFEIAGADDFTMTANTFTILSGSTIAIAAGGAITNAGSMAPDITSTGKALVMGF